MSGYEHSSFLSLVPVGSLDIDLVGDFRVRGPSSGRAGLPAPSITSGHRAALAPVSPAAAGGAAPSGASTCCAAAKSVSVELAESSLAEAGEGLGIRFDFSKLAGMPDDGSASPREARGGRGLHGRVLDAIFRACAEQAAISVTSKCSWQSAPSAVCPELAISRPEGGLRRSGRRQAPAASRRDLDRTCSSTGRSWCRAPRTSRSTSRRSIRRSFECRGRDEAREGDERRAARGAQWAAGRGRRAGTPGSQATPLALSS